MTRYLVSRFKLSDLWLWACERTGDQYSVSEALAYYMSHRKIRGWTLKAITQIHDPCVRFTAMSKRGNVQEYDALWTVIWEGDAGESDEGFFDFEQE
jgi:hypothetical protein